MKKKYVRIDGIHCNRCIYIITNKLLTIKNIKKVKIKNNIAYIYYVGKLSNKEIINSILDIDYFTKDEYISDKLSDVYNRIELKEFLIIATIIIIMIFIINAIFGYNVFNVIPSIDSSITYGMLFITGALTSIHCISMCGAINLFVIVDSNSKKYKGPILYNLGRITSYTLIGGIVGAIGSVISINDKINGIIILLSAIIMFLMSLNLLGIIDIRLPFDLKYKISGRTSNSFIIGLLNGFMPCGPLQAMQVYALSTGSFIKGATSMFLFSLGTVPLMLFTAVFYNLFRGKRKIIINKIASVLILILSIIMMNRAFLTLDLDLTKNINESSKYLNSKIIKDYQVIEFDLDYNNYRDIILQKDIKARIIINVDSEHLTGCNEEVVFNDFNIRKKLNVGKNIIEFTPHETGLFTYTCSMRMIKNNIRVIDGKNSFKNICIDDSC